MTEKLREIDLAWHGPFAFVPDGSVLSVFDCKQAGDRGVYLWTVEVEGGFLTNYVGETGEGKQTFAKRLAKHARCILGGEYDILDPELFERGIRKVALKKGMIREFLATYPQRANGLYRVLRALRVFLAPLVEPDIEHRKRIESAMFYRLHSVDNQCQQFLGNSKPKRFKDRLLNVHVKSPVTLIGINSPLTA